MSVEIRSLVILSRVAWFCFAGTCPCYSAFRQTHSTTPSTDNGTCSTSAAVVNVSWWSTGIWDYFFLIWGIPRSGSDNYRYCIYQCIYRVIQIMRRLS